MNLTVVQCPFCTGISAVLRSTEAALCPYCGKPYVVVNAAIPENISIPKIDGCMENLLNRAKQFEAEGETRLAIEYYNKVLD